MSEKRREKIIEVLTAGAEPVSGSALAKQFKVSRQVVVQDVAILRAKGYEIMATPQGYLLPQGTGVREKAVLAVKHTPLETEAELNTMVDFGLKVLDVQVEHPLYGELKGYLMLESRQDVKRFLDRVKVEGVSLLSSLTNGVHLHTVEYRRREDLEEARQALRKNGFLISE
ncbi:transcription repressor NadR [Desulfotruncus alcoholivorax]|uniref:transcription repressor NadR n=1 Tax=Desulfotruncus alcoholivorax TaxID=265477 RepID=UPI00055622DB|nr:transcription repressor NadR [Desulfotruncus alcoholivorax]